jgi:TonB family protein
MRVVSTNHFVVVNTNAFVGKQPFEWPRPPRYYQATDAGITRAKVVRERKPNYPTEDKLSEVQSEVFVECTVQPDGACSDIQVAKSLDPRGLDREAVRALGDWRFTPGTLRGEPVPVGANVEFRFTLR